MTTKTTDLNIYQIDALGESEWIAARTAIEALKFFCEQSEWSISELNDYDDIKLIPVSDWDMHVVTFPDERDEQGNFLTKTFAEIIEGEREVQTIASTAY